MQLPVVADYPAGAQLRPRTIDEFELVWMLRGCARYVAGPTEIPLAPGQLLLVPPGVRHGFRWDPQRPSRHGYVHFGPEILDGATIGEARVARLTPDDPLAGLCAYLLWLAHNDADDWPRHVASTLRFMVRLVLAAPLPNSARSQLATPALSVAIERLREEWSAMPLRRVGAAELAGAAHVSRGHLNRVFRAAFGLSVADALQRLRCSRAEPMLTRTDLSVQTIARQCGFANVSHFSHRFALLYGMPPSAYRAAGTGLPSVCEHPGVRRLSRLLWP